MGLRSAWKEDGIRRLEDELEFNQDMFDTYGDQEYKDMIIRIKQELDEERADLEELSWVFVISVEMRMQLGYQQVYMQIVWIGEMVNTSIQ